MQSEILRSHLAVTIEKQLLQLKAGLCAEIDSICEGVNAATPAKSARGLDVGDNPAVTCVCPTYGRFTRLRDAIACFVLQDYTPRRLLIVNDSGRPLKLSWKGKRQICGDGWCIKVKNISERYGTLGEKRNDMARTASTPLIAHWDDDDWYLPWHLSQMVRAQQQSGAAVVAQWPSYDGHWNGAQLTLTPVSCRPHDGGWLFVREWVVGQGYKEASWGETVALQKRAQEQQLFYPHNPQLCGQGISLARQRGDDGCTHMIRAKGNAEEWREGNRDHGHEQLMPGLDLDGFSAETWAQYRIGSTLDHIAQAAPGNETAFVLPKQRRRVFCVGHHKTGTSSLTLALGMLGWDVHPGFWGDMEMCEVHDQASHILNRYNAVADTPWWTLWEWLAQQYPDAKFILTLRDVQEWQASVRRHFGDVYTPMHAEVYGTGRYVGNEQQWRREYLSHNSAVQEWFGQNRPGDLLVLNICDGDRWPELCEFLDVPEPDVAFPHCKVKTTVNQHLQHCSALLDLPENEDSEDVQRFRKKRKSL